MVFDLVGRRRRVSRRVVVQLFLDMGQQLVGVSDRAQDAAQFFAACLRLELGAARLKQKLCSLV